MLKSLGAAVIAISLVAGPALAQGLMTAPASTNEANVNVAVPTPKAKVAAHKLRQHTAVKPVSKKHVVKKSVTKKHVAKKNVAKQVKHGKTIKSVKHVKPQAKVKAAI